MAPVKNGGNQPAEVGQDHRNVQEPDLDLGLNRSELLGDEYLNISSLFPENTVFLTPSSPEKEEATSQNADQAGQEPTVPKDVPYSTQTEATESKVPVPSDTPYYGLAGAPGPNPSFDHNEQQTNQERPISPLPILDFSCLTIGGQTLDDPLEVYNTLEPFIPDQPDAPINSADDLNLSQTKFDELHSPKPSPSPVEEPSETQSMEIEPVEQTVDPQAPIQIAISITPTAANAPQTVQWSMTVPSGGDATVPVDQLTTTHATQPIDPAQLDEQQQTILIYNPHAVTQETALTSVNVTPQPATVDLSLQNMLMAAARRKQVVQNPVVRHNVIPVVAYSRDQLTVIPTATPNSSVTSQSCAEFFSNFTDEVSGEDHPMGAQANPEPAAPLPGYLEIPSNYVVSSNGKQQIFKVHELYKAPLFHPLVEEEQQLVVNSAKATGKRRPRRTDIDYATGFECKPCQKTFGRKGSLEQHKRSHHAEPRPYLCKKCGKSFPSVQKLQQHEQNHLPGNKRFQCTDCEKRYVHAKDRDRHYLAHHGTGTFPCEECPKAFARRDHLLAHAVSHRKRQERAARKEAEKAKKQAAAKERAAKKVRRGSAPVAITESSSDSFTDYSSEESCGEMFRKISLNAAN